MKSNSSMQNIVILGAGFAGLRCAIQLERLLKKAGLQNDWSVVLVDKNSYHTYTPALYEAASAYVWTGAGKGEVQSFEEELGGALCLPISTILKGKNITFVHQEIADIGFSERCIMTKAGGKVPFQYLVIAFGSESIYFNIKGAKACCYALKTFYDALRIRRRIEEIFRSFNGNEIKITVVGGGATGVEVVAELSLYTRHLARDLKIDLSRVKILLLEAQDKILSGLPDTQRRAAARRLEKLGVQIRTGSRINEVEKSCVILDAGEKCPSDLIIWAAGVKAPILLEKFNELEKDKRGRITTDEFLRVKNHNNIFAIGDNALFVNEIGETAPPTAFIAEQQADLAALNILRLISAKGLLKYKMSIPGYVLSCGGKYGILDIWGITFFGFLGWALKRFIDLKYFLSILPLFKAFLLWFQELRMFTKND